jgi:hypothetical protein
MAPESIQSIPTHPHEPKPLGNPRPNRQGPNDPHIGIRLACGIQPRQILGGTAMPLIQPPATDRATVIRIQIHSVLHTTSERNRTKKAVIVTETSQSLPRLLTAPKPTLSGSDPKKLQYQLDQYPSGFLIPSEKLLS